MRRFIKDFVGVCARHLPILDPIYEFGAYQTAGQEGFADLRGFFPGKTYIGSDMRLGPGVDVILDLHHLELPDECIGAAILMDTLEHVEYPHLALQEVYRVLRPGGAVMMSSVMNFPIHDYPYDYWRFTPAAFQSLIKGFSSGWVDFVGEEKFPHTVVAWGVKGAFSPAPSFLAELAAWKQAAGRKTIKQAVREWIPPVAIRVYDQITGK